IPVINNEAEQPGGGGVGGTAARVEGEGERDSAFSMKSLLWHGGSAWDAWFSCASNQVVLTLSYSFSQLGMRGVILQLTAPERSKTSTSRIMSSSGSGCLMDCWGCTGKPSASSSSVLLRCTF
ncbi:unnamed protein product, partial [Musa acuminata subsp. burmannicoides]